MNPPIGRLIRSIKLYIYFLTVQLVSCDTSTPWLFSLQSKRNLPSGLIPTELNSTKTPNSITANTKANT